MKLCPKCQKQFSDDANFCPVDAARLVPLEAQEVATDALTAKFELGERLGGNRTGAVHRATDKATGQPAAVKIVAPAVVALPGLAQRLERELKQLERVQASGVARVLASGKRGDDSWVAIELLDDPFTLAEAVAARGAMPSDKAARLVGVIGEALIEAAQVGVVHRDLAPKNILFSGNDLKVINFSLPVPTTDKAPGVAEFVAPEQHDGKPVDQRSNLYSLGALYYFVLTSQPVQSDANGVLTPPSALAEVPEAVEAVILRALDRSPTRRFLTVRQFIDEVARVARDDGGGVRSTQPLGRAGRSRAEVLETIRGTFPGTAVPGVVSGTILGLGAPPAASAPVPSIVPPVVVAPAMPAMSAGPPAERSPWAPPASLAAPGPTAAPPVATVVPSMAAPAAAPADTPAAPVAAAPAAAPVASMAATPAAAPAAAPVASMAPSMAAAPAALVAPLAPSMAVSSSLPLVASPPVAAPAASPAAPVVPPPLLAAPLLGTARKSGKPSDGAKGKFRETMWFKKGDLDAQAALAAADEHARTGKVTSDKADLLPIDERYKDDGSLSRSDKDKYSLRTGGTQAISALRESGPQPGASTKVSEDELIGEMKGDRNKIVAIIAVALLAVALIVFLVVR